MQGLQNTLNLYLKNVQGCNYYTALGKITVVVEGFTSPRLKVLEVISKFCRTWAWNLPYVSLLTPEFLRLFQGFMKVYRPQQ